jgi:hypothetical protein
MTHWLTVAEKSDLKRKVLVLMSSKQKSQPFYLRYTSKSSLSNFLRNAKSQKLEVFLELKYFYVHAECTQLLINHFRVDSAYSEIISTLTQRMQAKMCWKNFYNIQVDFVTSL